MGLTLSRSRRPRNAPPNAHTSSMMDAEKHPIVSHRDEPPTLLRAPAATVDLRHQEREHFAPYVDALSYTHLPTPLRNLIAQFLTVHCPHGVFLWPEVEHLYAAHQVSAPHLKVHGLLVRLVVVGAGGVGKSTLVRKFADPDLCVCLGDRAPTRGCCPYASARPLPYDPIIGVDYHVRTVRVDRTSIKLQVWDTAGQSSFRSITSSYYRGADGVALVFDVYDAASWREVDVFAVELGRQVHADARVVLVGNHKIRSPDVPRQVAYDDALAYARRHRWLYYEVHPFLDVYDRGSAYWPFWLLAAANMDRRTGSNAPARAH